MDSTKTQDRQSAQREGFGVSSLPPEMRDKWRAAELEQQEREAERACLRETYLKTMADIDSLKKKQRPLPPYARHMSTAELNRTFCWYFLMRWEFYLALVSFVLFAAYFPWPWVADWGAVKALVGVMEQIVPSIAGLPQEARHLPLAASKAQLSFIHFCGGVAFIYKLVSQRPAVWREMSKLRFLVASTCFAVVAAYWVYAILFWAGNLNNGPQEDWHANRLQVVATHTVFWLFLTMTVSIAWSGIQEVIRQLKQS